MKDEETGNTLTGCSVSELAEAATQIEAHLASLEDISRPDVQGALSYLLEEDPGRSIAEAMRLLRATVDADYQAEMTEAVSQCFGLEAGEIFSSALQAGNTYSSALELTQRARSL